MSVQTRIRHEYTDVLLALNNSALSNLHWAILTIPLQREFSEIFRRLSDIFNIVRYDFESSSVSSKLRRLELAPMLHGAIPSFLSWQHVAWSLPKISDCRSLSTALLVADFIVNHRLHRSSPCVVNQFSLFLKHISVVWTAFELISSTQDLCVCVKDTYLKWQCPKE